MPPDVSATVVIELVSEKGSMIRFRGFRPTALLLMHSADDGQSWSKPVDISEQAMNPKWHWVGTGTGTGPGHGIQLKSGRLLIPCWADATPKLGEIQLSYAFFSDDHGKTWQCGEPLDADTSDECEAVELTDGMVYMNARSRQNQRKRAISVSQNGGKTWLPVTFDDLLPEPSCQGGCHSHDGGLDFREEPHPAGDAQQSERADSHEGFPELRRMPVVAGLETGARRIVGVLRSRRDMVGRGSLALRSRGLHATPLDPLQPDLADRRERPVGRAREVSCEAGRNPLHGGVVGTPAQEIPGRSINTWEKERR